MSYSILAGGTKDEAKRSVTRLADGNSSPEMPVLNAWIDRHTGESSFDGSATRVTLRERKR